MDAHETPVPVPLQTALGHQDDDRSPPQHVAQDSCAGGHLVPPPRIPPDVPGPPAILSRASVQALEGLAFSPGAQDSEVQVSVLLFSQSRGRPRGGPAGRLSGQSPGALARLH